MIQNYIFDFDGTIADTIGGITATMQETMVIGDTTFDIQMGNGAHCWTCAVTYGNHTREQLLTAEPNFIIDRFCDIVVLN